ncbi:MAG: CRISPR-associated endonuclease Cas2 [Candidatus Paceibacterota bacterium]|jgi:DNA-binding transcriptional regulator PaaX
MSVEREILEYFNRDKPAIKYKGIRVNLMGLPDFKYYKYQTLANKFSILSKKGFVKKMPNGEYLITIKGRAFLEEGKDILKKFETDKNKNSPKNLLLVYDIEENRKKERDWFRYHLKKFHFIMIQRSVWVGPSPLPKEFSDYLKEIKLGDNLKTFKLSKGYGEK